MSQQEEDAAVAKLVRDKAAVQKQYSLLLLGIREHAELIARAGSGLSNAGVSDPESVGIEALNKAVAAGGTDRLKADTDKMLELRKRVFELQAAAKDMGIE